jgi:hypothetical protein
MAVQENGITVVSVNTKSLVVQLYIGNIEIALRYRRGQNHFSEVYRSYLDGRRTTERPFISDTQWRDLIRQVHGIARSRGWKR